MRRPPTPLLFHAIALLAAYLVALWLYVDRVPATPGGLALASWLLLPLAELAAYMLLGSALLRGARGSRWRLPAFATLAAGDAGEFGRFYDWFIQSRHADDTLLVLTSDHAHYPEPPYVEVAGDDLAPFFVDRIPLLVQAPWLDLPARYDARGRTSLDFAPTLLQLSGVQDASNSFVGRTLFNPAVDKPLQVAAIGTSLYAIEDGRVKPAAKVSPGLAGVVADCRAWVERYYALERRNRIFPPL